MLIEYVPFSYNSLFEYYSFETELNFFKRRHM